MANSDAATGLLGADTVLAIVFVALKLSGNIDWSWWWVLCPLWLPFGVLLFLQIVVRLLSHP